MTPRHRHPWHFLRLFLFVITALLARASQTAHAGLLAEATRIIYPAEAAARTLTLTNTNAWPVVVQAWFDHGEGDPDAAIAPAFIATPAVFRLAPGAVQSLRIVATGEPLAADRESVWWLNLYEIPPAGDVTGHASDNAARLDLAINTQIKLFYRPPGLAAPENLAEQLEFHLEEDSPATPGHWAIVCHNPTAWHASFAGLSVAGDRDGHPALLYAQQAPDMMTPPHSTRRYPLAPGQPTPGAPVQFSLIDDGGFAQAGQGRSRHR